MFLKSFYWNTVDLQCCVSFSKVNSLYVYIYSLFLDYFPIRTITEYRVAFPALYSRSLLSILCAVMCTCVMCTCVHVYTCVHVNPNLQIYPAPTDPLITTNLFSISVTLFLRCK